MNIVYISVRPITLGNKGEIKGKSLKDKIREFQTNKALVPKAKSSGPSTTPTVEYYGILNATQDQLDATIDVFDDYKTPTTFKERKQALDKARSSYKDLTGFEMPKSKKERKQLPLNTIKDYFNYIRNCSFSAIAVQLVYEGIELNPSRPTGLSYAKLKSKTLYFMSKDDVTSFLNNGFGKSYNKFQNLNDLRQNLTQFWDSNKVSKVTNNTPKPSNTVDPSLSLDEMTEAMAKVGKK